MKMWKLVPLYTIVIVGALALVFWGSEAVNVMVNNSPIPGRTCIVIDPGHGGIDGGASSCTGVLESQINLEIGLRLNDLLNFLGYKTIMVRTTDTSIYTEGNTIAAQKVSDLKQRVKLVNEQEDCILISIHQNTFSDSKYAGAQVFYAKDDASKTLATSMQSKLIEILNPQSNRKSKPSDGIYLMQNITKPGLLIECGFLTNPQEEALLRNATYQQKLCCVIATTLSEYFTSQGP